MVIKFKRTILHYSKPSLIRTPLNRKPSRKPNKFRLSRVLSEQCSDLLAACVPKHTKSLPIIRNSFGLRGQSDISCKLKFSAKWMGTGHFTLILSPVAIKRSEAYASLFFKTPAIKWQLGVPKLVGQFECLIINLVGLVNRYMYRKSITNDMQFQKASLVFSWNNCLENFQFGCLKKHYCMLLLFCFGIENDVKQMYLYHH